ncbi:MAG: flagellar basal-body rod protein FlgF [Syntrophomonas sp.]|uniref:flagellar basal-body rod protein FlgF n=1 Tax=Syntrophomonas sp. TaxID=2053627 RepID=UPI00262E38BC|nr:flagellar basal-body rod protein FlgF [Syntrophomonas sp.]MDD2509551.1 flagellar basal-body rod protein FlgF [Syntrophomonas sp.]MDD3878422.1 flagellar basal-body rod protein FlgF [Syntrophomonas sp.]MDD4625479.1 flagellar basal-body rod protein FlgF [Syntrophomonas sp.]
MIRGLYTAGAGMMLQMARQDVVANNLANVNTSGFKKNTAVAKAFPDMLMSRLGECKENRQGQLKVQPPVVIGRLGTGAAISGIYTDFDNNNLEKTDSPCDLAITGAGYFVIQTPEGQRFTRCGEFKLNSEGILSTNSGYPVLDSNNSPINIEGEFSIDEQGNINVNGENLAQLKIVNFNDLQILERLGDNLLNSAEEPMVVERPEILQGYIEQSNVNAVKEMVTLISVVRAYESLQKMVQAEDETIGQAIEKVGSLN